MYGSIPGNAVIVNLLMRWPALIPVAAVAGITVAVPVEAPPVLVTKKTECVVLFNTDKFDILPAQRAGLKDCMKLVDPVSVSKVSVSGHTDSRASDQHNLVLSDNRAKAVKQVLVEMGINTNKIVAEFHGKTVPVADNSCSKCRQQNRRVTVSISH